MKEDIRPFEVKVYNPSIHELSGGSGRPPLALGVGRAVLLLTLIYGGYSAYDNKEDSTQIDVSTAPVERSITTTTLPGVESGKIVKDRKPSYKESMKALLDLIASGEGGYQSVNRGIAGDTPEDSSVYRSLLGGAKLTDLTVSEIQEKQKEQDLFAVGRYQFIPTTLASALKASKTSPAQRFSEELQDQLAESYLILGGKQPKLTEYLLGKEASLDEAVDGLCREFASLPCSNGKGRYDNVAGNFAEGSFNKVAIMKSLLAQLRSAILES